MKEKINTKKKEDIQKAKKNYKILIMNQNK